MQEVVASNEVMKTRSPSYCYFFPGILGTQEGMKKLQPALADIFQDSRIRVYSSSVSSEGLKKHLFSQQANKILADLEEAKKDGNETGLTFVLHSQGTTDFEKVCQEIEKNDPNFFNDPENIKRLNFILISPSGFFQGGKEALSYLGRVKQFMSSKTDQSIFSLHLLYPNNIDPELMAQKLTEAYSIQAQTPITQLDKDKKLLVEAFKIACERQKVEPADIDPKKLQKLEIIDKGLELAINKDDMETFKKLLSERAKLLKNEISVAFDGVKGQSWSQIAQAMLGMGIPFYKTMLMGEPYKRFVKLINSGYKVDFVQPEFDIPVPAKQIIEFIDSFDQPTHKPNVVFMQSSSHNSFAMRWQELASAIQRLLS